MLKIVGIAGSIRRESTHTAILRVLKERLADRVELDLVSLAQVPLYDEDLEHSPPQEITTLWNAVRSCDGMIIGTPEYNHGMSGVLKNALDWLSRPYRNSPIKGKAVLTFTASSAFTGGVRAQAQLNETISAVEAIRVAFPQIAVGSSHTKINNGVFNDEKTIEFMLEGVGSLIEMIEKN
ncbi:Quinone reductase [Paraburkholderia kirstenboschensis]|uniref:NADPH-dependent FMN reductase n=1 Tax=Paraburkholderia kirstenboschensis TaxID=1245436 RepID=UPI0019188692|nr:NAD(P)H-dependent oxidoreductase [Paraburkholderia kirstenboschensis]CAD6557298.1 Quinone reductase [Paraburkholderia kirstenboschensis]